MSTRKLLLLFVSVAAVLMFALLSTAPDGDSVSGAGTLRKGSEVPGGDVVLPTADGFTPGADGRTPVQPLGADVVAPEWSSPGEFAALGQGRISGRLVDVLGKPVADEPVLLVLERDHWVRRPGRSDDVERPRSLSASTRSDTEGRFALPARAGVLHALLAGGQAWARTTVPTVHAGDDLRVVLAQGLVLEGFVVEAAGGAPVPSAWVLAQASDDQLLVRSEPDGHFRAGPLPENGVLVGAWAPGFDVELLGNVEPAAGPVTLSLPAGREIRGRVLDRGTQQPVTAGGTVTLTADVLARLAGEEPLATDARVLHSEVATLDERGNFRFSSAPSLGFDLHTEAPGYIPDDYDRTESRRLEASDEVVITLRPLVPLAGRVILGTPDGGGNGAPVADARVSASGEQGEFFSAHTGADGRFTLDLSDWDGVPPVYVEAVDAGGTQGARVRLGKDDTEILLQLVPQLLFTAQVLRSGEPVAQAEVAVLSKRATATFGKTGADGTVALTHQLAGPAGDDGEGSEIRVQARFGDQQSLPLVLDATQPLPDGPVVLDLDSGAFVSGHVTDVYGVPVPSALVMLVAADADALDPGALQQLQQLGYIVGGSGGGGGADSDDPEADDSAFGTTFAAHTKTDGTFRLGPVDADGLFNLSASARDFRPGKLPGIAPGTADLALVLEPVIRWDGRVLDGASGLPPKDYLVQLQVEVEDEGALVFRNAKSQLDRKPGGKGEFSVTLGDRGRYQIRVWAQNYIAVTSAPADFNGVTAPPFVTLVMPPAAVLEITLQDSRGRPVSGYSVAAIPWEKGADAARPDGEVRKDTKSARTNEDGLVRFNLGEGGSFRIAGGPGLWLDDARLTVTPGPPLQRVYRLPSTGDLEVTVRDEQGQPLTGVRVEVRSARSEKVHSVTRQTSARNPDGKVLIEGLPPGDYDVYLRRRNYETVKEPVSIRADMLERMSAALKAKAP